MQIGDLDQRVTIQSKTPSTDTQGGRSGSFANIATDPTVWANVESVGGNEALELRQFIGATNPYRVRIRQRTGVTEKMRLLWTPRWPAGASQKALEIKSVGPDPKAPTVFMLLVCAEGAV